MGESDQTAVTARRIIKKPSKNKKRRRIPVKEEKTRKSNCKKPVRTKGSKNRYKANKSGKALANHSLG